MKSNNTKTGFKLISAQALFLCLFMAVGSSQAFAQCNYVTTEKGKETKVNIPCDFPVLLQTNKPAIAISSFNAELSTWLTKHPTFKNLNFLPRAIGGNTFIEIPKTNYNQLSEEKQKGINAVSYFYKVIDQTK